MDLAGLHRGALIAGRFALEAQVSWGVKGTLLRARDRETGALVALRVLPAEPGAVELGRMEQDLEALRTLGHPGIATPLGHGRLEQGQLFMAAEWVEGESLRHRLARRPLSAGESLEVLRQAATALGQAHRLGVVHRALRPSSLLIEGGGAGAGLGRVRVVDFGMQPAGLSFQTISGSSELVGAMQYMAPEQGRGEQQIGPGADVFALGCVLFECLTGRRPFEGRHAAEVLERVLYEEVPALDALRPGLPESLAQLLARMLAKAPQHRPADSEALAQELGRVRLTEAAAGLVPLTSSGARRDTPRGLGEEEQRLVSIVCTAPVALPWSGSELGELQRLVEAHGATLELLGDGSLQATMDALGRTAMDQAGQAARAALALRQRLGEVPLVVMTARLADREAMERGDGRTGPGEGAAGAGDGAERWGQELRHERAPGLEAAAGGVWLDELTGALVERRFHVRRVQGLLMLEGERQEEQGILLGRPTRYVGREQELRSLEMQYAACVGEEVARATLVIGAPGLGKSRLRREFLRWVEQQGAEVLFGQGDWMRAETAYGLLGQALLRLCGLGGMAEAGPRQRELAARLGRHVAAEERLRVVEFLGELCGVPPSGAPSPQLLAARQEPQLMREQVQAAWIAFLRAECRAQPVVLALEDVHWSDAATVGLVEATLRELAESSLLVLALGRPEVKELFPRLWESGLLHEMRLGGLGRRASEQLVQEVLGARATPEVVERIVAQADGNVLFLEELIRAVAEGHGGMAGTDGPGQAPPTVLAMVQARFQRLEPEARRVLRAASVFGERFWSGGVAELLGDAGGVGSAEPERILELLCRGEIIVREGESRYAGETQYGFRHGLLREAADHLLEVEDRRRGHGLAARYLERKGERDAVVLAEHYREAGEGEHAARWYAEAARRALENADSQSALRLAKLGLACGAQGETLGRLRCAESWARLWTSADLAGAYAATSTALELLPPGSVEWYRAMGTVPVCAIGLGPAIVDAHIRSLARVWPLAGAESASVEPGMGIVMIGCMHGRHDMAGSFLGRLVATCARLGPRETRAQGLLWMATLWYRLMAESDVWGYLLAAEQAMVAYAAAGDRRYEGASRGHRGCGHALLGDPAAGRREWQPAMALLAERGERAVLAATQMQAALALTVTGTPQALEEAFAMAETALDGVPMPAFWSGQAFAAQAEALLARGELAQAEAQARRMHACFQQAPSGLPLGCALLGQVLLAAGQVVEARQVVEEGMAALALLGGVAFMDVKLHLAAAEVYLVEGDEAAARRMLEEAERRIGQRAEGIEDLATRERYLEEVRVHARIRALLQGF
jgi:hypothetical protein